MFESVVILPGCGSREVHAAHSWRRGFLHLFKETCDGFSMLAWIAYTKEMEARDRRAQQTLYKKKTHKHRFEYKPSQKHLWVNPDRYVWICSDQQCNDVISIRKEELRRDMLDPYRNTWQ